MQNMLSFRSRDERLSNTDKRTGRMPNLFELNLPVFARIGISLLFMVALAAVLSMLSIPNPHMILVAGLVINAVLFDYPGGITAAVVIMAYTLLFSLMGHGTIAFTSNDLVSMLVTAIGVTSVCVCVCALKRSEDRALTDARTLATMLREDNQMLEKASMVDDLTHLRNRFSLRQDYPGFAQKGERLHVMMLDLDDFKEVNDSCGHEQGDRLLNEVGEAIMDAFGARNSYRYGGDEFLILVSGWTDQRFNDSCDLLWEHMKILGYGQDNLPVNFSGGYTTGTPKLQSDLRTLIRQADENLYCAKRSGKNQLVGSF